MRHVLHVNVGVGERVQARVAVSGEVAQLAEHEDQQEQGEQEQEGQGDVAAVQVLAGGVQAPGPGVAGQPPSG